MPDYQRTPKELEAHAVHWWPQDLVTKEAGASVIPILLASQAKFISILHVADAGPEAWKNALPVTDGLAGNLFLKHLMVLADLGGEVLKRLRTHLPGLFPDGVMRYTWHEKEYSYTFKSMLKASRLDNVGLKVDGPSLAVAHGLSDVMEDVAMFLLHASASDALLPEQISDKCMLGTLIGEKQALSDFVKQRYIWVSRITGGATANRMGQIAQDFVIESLVGHLPEWSFKRNGKIPKISQGRQGTLTSFDIVAKSPSDAYVAIEISFQVTTNSTIERKAGQAKARYQALSRGGHHIAYVIDGAGNFERAAALASICEYSDCTVAMSSAELETLAAFLSSLNKQPGKAGGKTR